MTQIRSCRRAWPALLLAGALLASAGITAIGADAETSPDASASPAAEASAEPTVEPTPLPTPYPTFDPSTVRIRTDLFIDGLDAPVYLTDDGSGAGADEECAGQQRRQRVPAMDKGLGHEASVTT